MWKIILIPWAICSKIPERSRVDGRKLRQAAERIALLRGLLKRNYSITLKTKSL